MDALTIADRPQIDTKTSTLLSDPYTCKLFEEIPMFAFFDISYHILLQIRAFLIYIDIQNNRTYM